MPSSAALHNVNAHAVLEAFFKAITPEKIKELEDLQKKMGEKYEPKVDYGTLYVQLITSLRKAYTQASEAEKKNMADLIYHLYHNDNHVLKRTYTDVLQHHVHTSSPTNPKKEEEYRHHVSEKSVEKYAAMSPLEAGGNMERFKSTTSSEFDPMSRGLPTIRRYGYSSDDITTEYRFPTQARRVNGKTEIDPLFVGFLAALKDRTESTSLGLSAGSSDVEKVLDPADKPRDVDNEVGEQLAPNPTHVYFNFVRRDERKFSGFRRIVESIVKECKKENEMTQALEKLGDEEDSNLTVITLPADDALMDKKAYLRTNPTLDKAQTTEMFINVVMENGKDGLDYKDFHIPLTVRDQLFPKGQDDIEELLKKSFKAVGLESSTKISEAQRQVVWFDFVNFQLTQLVIKTLNPAGFNFSCKDAIDRGAVASAWYNLRKSFDTSKPMSREEFEEALHAAALTTKGRGMNEHVNRLWNMVNEYVNNQADELKASDKSWLILWRDMHCPEKRATDVLETRLASARERLKLHPNMNELIAPLLDAIEAERKTVDVKWMGTLLEVVGRTMSLMEHKVAKMPASKAEQKAYDKLIKKVSSHAELGLFAKFMLWIQGKLTGTRNARNLVVRNFNDSNRFFSNEPQSKIEIDIELKNR